MVHGILDIPPADEKVIHASMFNAKVSRLYTGHGMAVLSVECRTFDQEVVELT